MIIRYSDVFKFKHVQNSKQGFVLPPYCPSKNIIAIFLGFAIVNLYVSLTRFTHLYASLFTYLFLSLRPNLYSLLTETRKEHWKSFNNR